MNTKKDPAALERGPGTQTTFTNSNLSTKTYGVNRGAS